MPPGVFEPRHVPFGRHAPRRLTGLAASVALHACGLALIVLLPSRLIDTAAAPAGAPPVQVAYIPALPTAPPESADRVLTEEHETIAGTEEERVIVSGMDIDITKVRARRNDLFPFLTLDLMFLERIAADVNTPPKTLLNPLSAAARRSHQPPLSLTDAELRQTIDRSWSRRQRWSTFGEIAMLIDGHDANEGRAPEVLRAYLDQNILQPFCDTDTRDPRFWAMLDNAADHTDFIDLVRSYARRHPSSRTTTELLFLLDELAQASRDVLLMVLDTRPARDLARTAASHREAYQLAAGVRDHYGRWLLEHGLGTAASIKARYDDLRLRLLSTIIETTPAHYREGDARFLAGEIHFTQGNLQQAGRLWRGITPDARDAYVRVYSELRTELQSPKPVPHSAPLDGGGADLNALQTALRNEYARWRLASIDRLHRFGHSCDSF